MPLTMMLVAAASAVFGAGVMMIIEGLRGDRKVVLPEDIGAPPVPPQPVWRQTRSPFAPKEKPKPLPLRRTAMATAGGDVAGRTAASPPPKNPPRHHWPDPIERKPVERNVLPSVDWNCVPRPGTREQ